MRDISIPPFLIARVSLNLSLSLPLSLLLLSFSKSSSTDGWFVSSGRSGTNTESFGYHHSASIVRSAEPLEHGGWFRPSCKMLTLTFLLSRSLSLLASLSPFCPPSLSFYPLLSFSSFTEPTPTCVQVRGRRITASSRGRLAPGNNPHGPSATFLPTRHVNPINALRRPQTKKSPPGTPELPRVRHVSVLKCPFIFGLLPSVDLIARRSSHGK